MHWIRSYRATTALSVVLLLVIGEVLIAPVVADGRTLCQRATAWVAAHSNNLPATIEGLSQYPEGYRRAIFTSLPPAVRSSLFREQLRRFAGSRELSADQTEAVALASSLFSPEFYEANGVHGDATQLAFSKLGTRLSTAFTSPDDLMLFHQIGPTDPTAPRSAQALMLRLNEGLGSILSAQAFYMADCVCTVDDPDPTHPCDRTCAWSPECDPQGGCGTGGGWTCNGNCNI
jgi:hypothetical protein